MITILIGKLRYLSCFIIYYLLYFIYGTHMKWFANLSSCQIRGREGNKISFGRAQSGSTSSPPPILTYYSHWSKNPYHHPLRFIPEPFTYVSGTICARTIKNTNIKEKLPNITFSLCRYLQYCYLTQIKHPRMFG